MWRPWVEALLGDLLGPHTLLVAGRLAPLMLFGFLLPRRIGVSVRILLLLALTLYFAPLFRATPLDTPFPLALLLELGTGLFIALLVHILFATFESAGTLVGQYRGGKDPSTQLPFGEGSSLGALYGLLATLLLFTTSGHLLFVRAIGLSFQTVPLGTLPPLLPHNALLVLLHTLTLFMTVAALLVLPVVVTLFLSDLLLGILSRFYPSINAYFLAMPLKGVLGLFVLMVALPLIPLFFHHLFSVVVRLTATLSM